MPSDYRLSPALSARLLGLSLAGLGGLVLLTTMLVVLFRVPVLVLSAVVVLCVVAVFTIGWFLTRRARVVRLTEEGYVVRYVRGAGVTEARWADVEEAVTDTIAGSPCVVFRLRNGTSTTIPVEVLAVDKEQFVEDVLGYLERHGHGRARRRRKG